MLERRAANCGVDQTWCPVDQVPAAVTVQCSRLCQCLVDHDGFSGCIGSRQGYFAAVTSAS